MALATRSDGDRKVFFDYMEELKLPKGWRVEDAADAVAGKVSVSRHASAARGKKLSTPAK